MSQNSKRGSYNMRQKFIITLSKTEPNLKIDSAKLT